MSLSNSVKRNQFLNILIKVQKANDATNKTELLDWWKKETSLEARIAFCVDAIYKDNPLFNEIEWKKLPLGYMSLILNGVKELSLKKAYGFIEKNLDKLNQYQENLEVWGWIFTNYDMLSKDLKTKLQPYLHNLPKEVYGSSPTRIHCLESISEKDIPLLIAAASKSDKREFHKDLNFQMSLINTLESLELTNTQINREIATVITRKFIPEVNQNNIPETLFEVH